MCDGMLFCWLSFVHSLECFCSDSAPDSVNNSLRYRACKISVHPLSLGIHVHVSFKWNQSKVSEVLGHKYSSCKLLTNTVIQDCVCDCMCMCMQKHEACWDWVGCIMSITKLRDPHEARDRYMSGALRDGMLLWGKWTTGTCSGCLCKPEVLTANDSYPYSPHPDWWWQKGRYSSACVTQLLWLLLPKALQLDKGMKPNNSTNNWQQKYSMLLLLYAVHTFLLLSFLLYSASLQLPIHRALILPLSLWPSVSCLKKSM